MKNKKKQDIIIIRVTDLESKMAKELREDYSINISSLLRKSIHENYNKITKKLK